MIYLKKSDYNKIVAYAGKNLSEETCGLLGGVKEGEEKTIEKVYFLTNLDRSSVHFSMDPMEQLAAVKDMHAQGLTLLGNWHSHPQTPALPSEEDRRLAFDSTVNYLILSLMDGEPVLRTFVIDKDRNVSEEEITVTG